MSEKLIDEIRILLEKQPLLDIEETENEYILNGLYKYCLEYNSHIMKGERRVKLCIMKNFPYSIPKLYVYDCPNEMEHKYTDDSVCLATIGEILQFLTRNSSLIAFIDKFVDSFIFSLDWFEKYKTYPFGERKHGGIGLLDYYLNDLNLTVDQYKKMVVMIDNNKYRGHSKCFCGSGKKLRECHGNYILPLMKSNDFKRLFLKEVSSICLDDEAYGILREDKMNGK